MIDEIDHRILSELQKNAHLTSYELSEKLNLSQSQAGRRRQRLEREGYIKSYRAEINGEKLGLHVQAFIQVQLSSQGPEQGKQFARTLRTRTEIVAAWSLTGEADYLLRVFCQDLKTLNSLIQDTLLHQPAVLRVQSQIVMDQAKEDSPLPTR